jgi:7-keto-8-aminopelargonate synthetase-like enzyme
MAMALSAIDLIEREPERRETLWRNSHDLGHGLRALGFELGPIASPILPLIIGDAARCMRVSEELLKLGVFAQAIRPPTVPPGTSRLRITIMATHTPDHIARALHAFSKIRKLS